MKIKGNFLKDYVQIVEDNPELDWNKYLTKSDWEIVRSTIIPLSWYPAETMGRIGRGIFEMRSKKDYSLVRLHGRSRVDQLFDEATLQILRKDSPVESCRAYCIVARRYIDEVEIKLGKSGPQSCELSWWPVDNAPSWDLFREIQAGTLERLVELNGGKNAKAEFRAEQKDGREACVVCLTWE